MKWRRAAVAIATFSLTMLVFQASGFAGCNCECTAPDGTSEGRYQFPSVPDPSVYRQQCINACGPQYTAAGDCMSVGPTVPMITVDWCSSDPKPATAVRACASTVGSGSDATYIFSGNSPHYKTWCIVSDQDHAYPHFITSKTLNGDIGDIAHFFVEWHVYSNAGTLKATNQDGAVGRMFELWVEPPNQGGSCP